ncbi:hypothetical protein BU23DRAFT_891 [Bimuria novae-zelandiae CBS 107.79]|uniref:Uncharacterized protein n=1 Tax=Bimuria novae-zelandiae CBS 107.79 TaxID=1447943 RepID=A0A6A5W3I6_9PLEO|nr:hypothetical protein BU23DRAFT_891 [Bimuria novae-zelandiae CBS 107.79]
MEESLRFSSSSCASVLSSILAIFSTSDAITSLSSPRTSFSLLGRFLGASWHTIIGIREKEERRLAVHRIQIGCSHAYCRTTPLTIRASCRFMMIYPHARATRREGFGRCCPISAWNTTTMIGRKRLVCRGFQRTAIPG